MDVSQLSHTQVCSTKLFTHASNLPDSPVFPYCSKQQHIYLFVCFFLARSFRVSLLSSFLLPSTHLLNHEALLLLCTNCLFSPHNVLQSHYCHLSQAPASDGSQRPSAQSPAFLHVLLQHSPHCGQGDFFYKIHLIMSLLSIKCLFSLALGIRPKSQHGLQGSVCHGPPVPSHSLHSEHIPHFPPSSHVDILSAFGTVILTLEAGPLAYNLEHSFSSHFVCTSPSCFLHSSIGVPSSTKCWFIHWIKLKGLLVLVHDDSISLLNILVKIKLLL